MWVFKKLCRCFQPLATHHQPLPLSQTRVSSQLQIRIALNQLLRPVILKAHGQFAILALALHGSFDARRAPRDACP
jgi:hypothetical protein